MCSGMKQSDTKRVRIKNSTKDIKNKITMKEKKIEEIMGNDEKRKDSKYEFKIETSNTHTNLRLDIKKKKKKKKFIMKGRD